jgi:hypothetical protein
MSSLLVINGFALVFLGSLGLFMLTSILAVPFMAVEGLRARARRNRQATEARIREKLTEFHSFVAQLKDIDIQNGAEVR